MKCKQLILIVAFALGTFGMAYGQGAYVDVNEVTGLVNGLIPEGGGDLIIPVRYTNSVEARSCISNGFVFTSDNVTFTSVSGQWNPNYPWDLDHAMILMQFPMFYDVGLFINQIDSDTDGNDDGVGFAGLSNSGSGLPIDFDDVAVYITVTGVTGNAGEVLTMDSSFWIPANVWLWCGNPTYYPTWGGPYEFEFATGVDFANGGALPTAFSLKQNYPNPFNPTTDVYFDVPTRSNVKIEIFNVLGRRVSTLVDEEMAAGSYLRTWNGTNEKGTAVSSGVYLYKMQAGDFVESKKMMLLK